MNVNKLYKMNNTIQEYAWGSIDAIPRLLGFSNKEKTPKAELWMGAHDRGPSMLISENGEVSLADFIKENPEDVLGKIIARQYDVLPYLFKVLAAGSPLSIQVHPDKKQAEEGFARENRLGIALDAPNRNYKDDNHKPEIICALTDFWAMRGFRPIDEIISRFEQLHIPVFSDEIKSFASDPTSRGLENFFDSLTALEGDRKNRFISQLTDALNDKSDNESDWVRRLYEKYPDDAAIAAPLYLNLVKLAPGEALYLDAGELHAYLDGLGMELMASSDNVLRGGLTPKYIDREELKKIVRFTGSRPEILKASSTGGGIDIYDTPSKEFELSRILLEKGETFNNIERGSGPQILFITEGEVDFQSPEGEILHAGKGDSLFVPAKAVSWQASGKGVLYRASVPGGGIS